MMISLERWVVAGTLALVCVVGSQGVRAADIVASEAGDIVFLVGTQFDVTPFTAAHSGESANGSGAFAAPSTATGMALVVMTEGAGGPNSDWFELVYSGGFRGTESVTAHWRSDADPGGLPALPTGVTPEFLVESGASQDITGLLIASATASGFAFPSNIRLQAQSDAPEVSEPASLALLSVALAGLGGLGMVRRRKHE